MDGLEEKLSAILNDPNSMEQILSLAKNLGIGPPPSTSSSEQAAPVSTPEDTSAPLLDEKMLHTFLSLMQNGGQINDRQDGAAQCPRPFLNPARRNSVDRAVRIARLTGIAEAALRNGGLRL